MDKMVDEEGLKDTFPYLDNITVAGRNQQEHDENVKNFHVAIQRRNLTLNKTKSVENKSSINILGYCVGDGIVKPDQERLRPLQDDPPPTNTESLSVEWWACLLTMRSGYQTSLTRLVNATSFPLDESALSAFDQLKKELERATLHSIDESQPFVVECDASEVCVSATLNQCGRPVAFMSRTLQGSELHYPPVEKEATAIVEAVRKWRHFLAGRHFTLVTDQRSVAFMIDNRKRSKIKNNKIQS